MLRCSEVARMVASDEFRDAGWIRRLSLRMHLAMCRHCRRFARQVDRLGTEARRSWTATDADESALQRIEQALRDRSSNADST